MASQKKSKRFKLNQDDAKAIGKVIAWTMASALIAVLIDVNQAIEFPVEYAFIPGIINSVLVAGKKFVQEKRE